MTAPNLILDGGVRELEGVRGALEADGWRLHDGWELPADPWDVEGLQLACLGEVASRDDASAAVAAAARGAHVVAAAPASRVLAAQLFEDLRRLGPVEYRRPDGALPAGLEPELANVLRLLAEGLTLEQAAARLHYSRRTVARRLASARTALGVRTTAEALVRFKRETGG